jgi:hypothetical protein
LAKSVRNGSKLSVLDNRIKDGLRYKITKKSHKTIAKEVGLADESSGFNITHELNDLGLLNFISGKSSWTSNIYIPNDVFLSKRVASALVHILPSMWVVVFTDNLITAFYKPVYNAIFRWVPNSVSYVNKKPSIISLKEKEGLNFQKKKNLNQIPKSELTLPTRTLSMDEQQDKMNALLNLSISDIRSLESNYIAPKCEIARRRISPTIEGLPLRLTLQGQIILSMFPDGVIQHVLVQYLQCDPEKIHNDFAWFFKKCDNVCIERNIKPNKLLSFILGQQFGIPNGSPVTY